MDNPLVNIDELVENKLLLKEAQDKTKKFIEDYKKYEKTELLNKLLIAKSMAQVMLQLIFEQSERFRDFAERLWSTSRNYEYSKLEHNYGTEERILLLYHKISSGKALVVRLLKRRLELEIFVRDSWGFSEASGYDIVPPANWENATLIRALEFMECLSDADSCIDFFFNSFNKSR